MTKKTDGKPKKLLELEAGEYKLVRVSAKLSPIAYKTMRQSMEDMGITNESAYVQMGIALMNQKSPQKN